MRISLIFPNVICGEKQIRRTQPPLGIGTMAAVLESKGHAVQIIDTTIEGYEHVEKVREGIVRFGLPNDKVADMLTSFTPDIVGISVLFSSQMSSALALAEHIKKTMPKVTIVMGGNPTSMEAGRIAEQPYVDFVLKGEADLTFLDFVDLARENHFPAEKVIEGTPKGVLDMNTLPFPAWHLMNMEKYFEIGMFHNPFVKSKRVGTIMTSRGCPFQCYFCSTPGYWGTKFRPMSAEKVVQMVSELVRDYQIKEIQVLDDNFTVDYQRVLDICEGIKNFGLRITFPNATRADLPRNLDLRKKMYEQLRAAGCEQIAVSVEHGDQTFLNKVINKALPLDEISKTIGIAHEAGLLIHCNFMLGFPFETKEQREKTVAFAKSLGADSYSVSIATPLPGTPLWDIVHENNLLLETFTIDSVLYDRASILPQDITVADLEELAVSLNRELNHEAKLRNPAAQEKYNLVPASMTHGDRKYSN